MLTSGMMVGFGMTPLLNSSNNMLLFPMRFFILIVLFIIGFFVFGIVFNILFKIGILLLLGLGVAYLLKKIFE